MGMTEQQRAELMRQRLTKQSKLLKRWRQVNVLLKAAFGFPIEEASWDAMDIVDTTDIETDRKWRRKGDRTSGCRVSYDPPR